MWKRFEPAIGCLALLAGGFLLAFMWLYVWDTGSHRRRLANEIRTIAAEAKQNPDDSRHVQKLLQMTRSDYSIEATMATSALGRTGDAAIPVVSEIAELMNSSNPYVRREAAIALGRLGKRSEPVLPELKAKVAEIEPPGDAVWFAAEAIGEIGYPAVDCIPLLKSKLGTGASQFDDCLNRAIEKLNIAKQEHDASVDHESDK